MAKMKVSLRRSIIFYMIAFVLIAMILSAGTSFVCDRLSNHIRAAYPETREKYYLTNVDGERLGEGTYISKQEIPYSEMDKKILGLLDVFPMLVTPIYSAICVFAAAFLFYRNKLKNPINELEWAAEKISNSNLNFKIQYESDDELGELCRAFEVMRSALADNFSEMWRQVEERKRLNAAFAHDLRTPLTVLKGYGEMLQTNDDPQVGNTAMTILNQVSRLERYADSMSRLQRLEETRPQCQPVDVIQLASDLKAMAVVVAGRQNLKLCFENNMADKLIEVDLEFVEQVYNNLISNAVRYAQSNIRIRMLKNRDMFCLEVADDGPGFSVESLKRAAEPYFTEEDSREENLGLGLYICRMMCENHGGYLVIENTEAGGRVTAGFKEFYR